MIGWWLALALAAEAPSSEPVKTLKAFVPATGGLTAEAVGENARQKAWDVGTKRGSAQVAASRADATIVDFIPRLQGIARYTRLSPITQAPVIALEPEQLAGLDPSVISALTSGFPVLVDNWLFQLTATLPVSDYIFRLVHNRRANVLERDATREDLHAIERKAAADARIAFYAWVKSLVQVEVAEKSTALAQENFRDAERLYAVGRSSKADVLQLQSRLAATVLVQRQAEQAQLVAAEQLRRKARLEEQALLTLGEDLSEPLAQMELGDAALLAEALEKRPELRVASTRREALKSAVATSRAAYFPRLEGFGTLLYGNPNPRFIPPVQQFRLTWEVGAQIVWTLNDTARGVAQVREAEGRLMEAEADAGRVRDALLVEVQQALSEVRSADASVVSADASLAAAAESFRARRELYQAGRANSTELLATEIEVARALLAAAIARIDQRQSRTRLDYAVGR